MKRNNLQRPPLPLRAVSVKTAFLLIVCAALSTLLPAQAALDKTAFPLNGATFSKGMIRLNLVQGMAAPILFDGKPAGFLFSGSGNWEADVKEPFARQVLPYNAKHGSHLSPDGFNLRDDFTVAVCLGKAAVALLPQERQPGGDLARAFEQFDADFLDQEMTNPIAFVLAGLANGTDEFAAVLRGGKDDIAYFFDPVWGLDERLSAIETGTLRRKGRSNLRWMNLLAGQPLSGDRKLKRSSPLKLTAVNYDFDLTDFANLHGAFRETFTIQRGGMTALQLQLPNNYLYFSGDSGGFALYNDNWTTRMEEGVAKMYNKVLTVDRAAPADGKDLVFSHYGDVLTLYFPEPLKPGQKLELTTACHGDIFEPIPEMGSSVILSGLNWFPVPSNYYEGIQAVFSGRVKTKKPIVALAGFETAQTKEEGGILTLEGSSEHPNTYHSLAIGKFFPKTSRIKDVEVTTASAVFENKRAYDLLSGLVGGVLDLYTRILGEFPFKRLTVVEGRGYGYGFSPPTMVFASGEIFNSMRDEDTQAFSQGANERFAHELAHQYFGHKVKSARVEDRWLTEAMAEYMAAFFIDRAKSKKEFKSMVNFWANRAKRSAPVVSPYAVNLLDGHDAGLIEWDITYCKGPLILHAMRQKMGDQMFWTVFRSFLKSFPYQTVTTEDFIGLTNFISKDDWQPFFDRYVYGTEMPPLQADE
jgi:hypothetical protein